jgi:hypothetical protein
MGYYGVFLGMQYHNDVTMTRILDANQYDEAQTITVKVPMSLPYMTDDSDFERVDGKFEHEGEVYRLVKQKYVKDTLTVVCVKDFENKRIRQALSNYVKTFTDQANNANEHSKVSVNFIKDYLPQTFSLKSISSGWETNVIKDSFYRNLIPAYISSVIHPPERG